jgi:xylulokinase
MRRQSPTLLALDVGTTEARATVHTLNGVVTASGRSRHTLAFAGTDQVEVDAWELVGSVTSALRAVGASLANVCAVAVGAELGTVFVDSELSPLGNALCWPDKRAWREAAWIADDVGRATIYATTGRVVDPELPAAKYLWVERNEPERAKAARWLLSIKDFLVSVLCGCAVTDETHASYSMLFDVRRREWSADLAASLGIGVSLLPPVLPASAAAGTITRQAAELTGLRQGTLVAVGGPDGTVGTLGMGLVRPGVTTDLVGTADVVFHGTATPVFDPAQRAVVNAHAVGGLWAVGGPTGTTGGTVARAARLLGYDDGAEGLATLDSEATLVPPGSDGLAFMTSLAGDRFPAWDPTATGVLFGLRLGHTRGHVARAALEGAAYTLRGALEVYRELGLDVKEIRVAGGGARSRLWSQVRADVCGVPLVPVDVREATSLGAAMLASVCAGAAPGLAELSDRLISLGEPVRPRPEEAAAYRGLYSDYLRLRSELGASFSFWSDRQRHGVGAASG